MLLAGVLFTKNVNLCQVGILWTLESWLVHEKVDRQMCMRMNVSLRMVHLRTDAWHASVCRNRASEPEPVYGEYCGSGVRCTVVTGCGKGTLGRALFALSYDIVHAVAKTSSSPWWNV